MLTGCFSYPIAWIAPFHALNSVDHEAIGSLFAVSLVRYHVHSFWAKIDGNEKQIAVFSTSFG